ncbi:PTS transporter subunit EIIB [Lactiplantibacillus sp. WILCCON 0030]|uniref:PTS transporter subunit EIIB n=1 Tax=Lactiplantibacillus brownii TaxID=3069269 RepID=A0ABU1ACL6_9LACO|nr:PTS transporter subunit EIIB [Lactiplantibacillus brownii]MDQ7938668.1 PTS transporter subunit EIIB [Lactiplantibacillus brownii]
MGKRNSFSQQAVDYLKDLGGSSNIDEIVNCASRIRVSVNDTSAVATNQQFIADGAMTVVRHGKAIQVIVGLDVPQILSVMRQLISGLDIYDAELDEYGLTPVGEKATMLYECFGLDGNIQQITVTNDQVMVQVKDVSWVDPFDIMLQLGIGVTSVKTVGNRIFVEIADATDIARQMLMMNMYKTKELMHHDSN